MNYQNKDSSTMNVQVPLAYIRPVSRNESDGYVVCAVDGTQLAIFATKDAALYTARQHELEPALIH